MKRQTHFGDTIKKRRLELGLTQKALADKLKVAQNFVTYLEKEQRKPSDKMLQKMAATLKLPTDELYFAAHPELSKLIDLDQDTKKMRQKMPPILLELKKDKALRSKHNITHQEIEQLASIQFLGEVKTKEDYVFLLLSIRQAFK